MLLSFNLKISTRRKVMAKTTVLPKDAAEIVRRLTAVCDEHNVVEKIYPTIAQHAGAELLPQGITVMFTLAAYDFGQEYPPPMGTIIMKYVPRWIDALIDDKEVAEEAKKFLKQAEDDAAADHKAKTPPRVEPSGPVEDYNLFVAARRVADIFDEEVDRAKKNGADLWVEIKGRKDGANPYYHQTENGLFLEYYYGHPDKVWTPWGYWQFAWSSGHSGNPWPKIMERMLKRLGATLYIPERNERYGTVGPVYAIHQVDKTKLPEPKERERQNFLEYEVAKNAWESMSKRYKLDFGRRVLKLA